MPVLSFSKMFATRHGPGRYVHYYIYKLQFRQHQYIFLFLLQLFGKIECQADEILGLCTTCIRYIRYVIHMFRSSNDDRENNFCLTHLNCIQGLSSLSSFHHASSTFYAPPWNSSRCFRWKIPWNSWHHPIVYPHFLAPMGTIGGHFTWM